MGAKYRTIEDSLIDSIISLKPESIPLNFYIPNPALPIKNRNISTKEALNIIKKSRKLLGEDGLLMVAWWKRAPI